MSVTRTQLLTELPPCRDEWVMIAKEQRTKDIIRQMVDGYPIGAPQYDIIAHHFEGATVRETCENLYAFCKKEIRYKEEGVDWQSNELPNGILTRGFCDCKGYANFIGGCLGALNRANGGGIDWVYYFASYEIKERDPYHVFVQVTTEDGVMWVDPTPETAGLEPVWQITQKINEPVTQSQHIAGVNERGELFFDTMGAVTQGSVALDAIMPGLGEAVSTAISYVPDGETKQWLNGFMKNPVSGVEALIKGHTYTSGDYALGEMYMRNILGMEQIQNRWDVTDQWVPQAWEYFTAAFGVRIRTNDDLDALGQSASAYLSRNPGETPDISMAQAERAHELLNAMGLGNKRDQLWPVQLLAAEPYIYPIPGILQNTTFSGVHPITGQLISNGYPVGTSAATTTAATLGVFGGMSTGMIIILAAAALGIWWLAENE